MAVDELGYWPQAPPHWIHLPPDIKFASTNSQDLAQGRAGHNTAATLRAGATPRPKSGWTAHLQAVLSGATQ